MDNTVITLELTQEETNQVLLALAKLPYREVFALIAKIQEQGNKQIEEKQCKSAT